MSSDSEHTDSDDPDVPLSQSKTKSGSYSMKGALQAPRATSYTTQSLFDQIVGDDIDLNADYQRDVVWPDYKQSGLIDSVFRNFYIPPLIFAVKYNEDGSETRVCIDGKQRLTSIYRFLRGDIPYKDPYTSDKFLFKTGGAFSRKAQILPQRYKKIFCNKQIVCMEYQDLTSDNEREIFQRVQLGMALTPAEKLQAINSDTATFIRELQTQYVTDGLASTLDWDISRGADFRCLSTSVYNMVRWPSLSTLVSLAQVQGWLQQTSSLPSSFCDDIHAVFQIFLTLAKDSKLSKVFRLPGVAKVAPVEFMAISLLIYVHREKLTLAQLAEAIGKMRKEIRTTETDIRMNARVMKPMLAFIKDLKVSTLKEDSDTPAAVIVGPMKRKRAVKSDPDDDVEMRERHRPSPAATRTTTSQPSASGSTSARPNVASASPSVTTQPQPSRGPPPTPLSATPTTSRSSGSSVPDRLAAVRLAKSESHPPPSAPAALRNVAAPRPPNGSAAGSRPGSFSSFGSLPPPPALPPRFALQTTTLEGRTLDSAFAQRPNAPPLPYPNGAPSAYPNGFVYSQPPPAHDTQFRDVSQMGTPLTPGPASAQGAPFQPSYDPRRDTVQNGHPLRPESAFGGRGRG